MTEYVAALQALAAGTKLAKEFIDTASKRDKHSFSVMIDSSRSESALSDHLQMIATLSSEITMKDADQPHSLESLYIRLSCMRSNAATGFAESEPVPPEQLLKQGCPAVLLGLPGAGKSTTVRYLCQRLLRSPDSSDDRFGFPLLIRLREIEPSESITEALLRSIGVVVEISGVDRPAEAERLRRSIREQVLVDHLNGGHVAVFLDGLDELPSGTNATICGELSRLTARCTSGTILVTCRQGAYNTTIERCDVFKLVTFSLDQVSLFSKNWFGSDETAARFVECLRSKPYAGIAQTPLHATNLCMIFEAEGDLPVEHTRVYEKIVNVRLREWDLERNVVRKGTHEQLGPDEKRRLLSSVAFYMAKKGVFVTFLTKDFSDAFKLVAPRFELSHESHRSVLSDLEAHTGIVCTVGFDKYEYYHKTIQEYLCAEHLSGIPVVSTESHFLANMPDSCAIAVILSHDPDGFLFCFCNSVFSRTGLPANSDIRRHRDFWSRFVTRLVEENARIRGDVCAGIGVLCMLSRCHSTRDDEAGDVDQGSRQAAIVASAITLMQVPGAALALREALADLCPWASGTERVSHGVAWVCVPRRVATFESTSLGVVSHPLKEYWIPKQLLTTIG